MIETQQSISQWAAETFGQPGGDARVAARVYEEFVEILRALTSSLPEEKIAEEAADTAIVLFRLADRRGLDLALDAPKPDVKMDPYWLMGRGTKQMSTIMSNLLMDEAEYEIDAAIKGLMHTLQRLCWSLDQDLGEAIDRKMAINRKRKWQLDGTGHGRHIRDREVRIET